MSLSRTNDKIDPYLSMNDNPIQDTVYSTKSTTE